MKAFHVPFKRLYIALVAGTFFLFLSAFLNPERKRNEYRLDMPYKKMGLTEAQAAAHLLSRFSFGATPGQVEQVAQQGLDTWLQQQLACNLPDDDITRRLPAAQYEALKMDDEEIVNTYLNAGQIIRIAAKNKLFDKDSVRNLAKPEYRAQLKKIMDAQGYKLPQELQRQLINQKIIRAAYGQNQLQEVLTDFWFNHFNVSLTKGQCQQYVLTYERDAIRPHVLGHFEDLLVATAQHPAMLEYLDNASSVSNDNAFSRKQENNLRARAIRQRLEAMAEGDSSKPGMKILQQTLKARKTQGLNENFAREVMELHTLGVDGGYTQKDVTEVARALTGWGIRPMYKDGLGKKLLERANTDQLAKRGYIIDGDFMFREDKHDENPKTILGKNFPANGGYREGLEVLHMLANHPSTAHFICNKLATRFVCDTPSADLVNKMAATFLQTKGDIKAVIVTMVNSDDFWGKSSLREKVKSPFEYAISAIRATNADVQQPFQIYTWCMKMGQRFYFYQAPTGFPDRASYWINTGALLSRMNFGLAFATQKIPGVKLNLPALNNNHEPESAEAALVTYSKILLPERNLDDNIRRLTAIIRDEHLQDKLNDATQKNPLPAQADTMQEDNMTDEMAAPKRRSERANEKAALSRKNIPVTTLYVAGNTNTVSQVAGIIIGSPEFQRR